LATPTSEIVLPPSRGTMFTFAPPVSVSALAPPVSTTVSCTPIVLNFQMRCWPPAAA